MVVKFNICDEVLGIVVFATICRVDNLFKFENTLYVELLFPLILVSFTVLAAFNDVTTFVFDPGLIKISMFTNGVIQKMSKLQYHFFLMIALDMK